MSSCSKTMFTAFEAIISGQAFLMSLNSLFNFRISCTCFLLLLFSTSIKAAELPGFDVGVLGNVYDTIKSDGRPLAWGSGAGALVHWQWSADWRSGMQIGCISVCAGNLEIGYRAQTISYSRFRYPERLIYYIIGLGIHEVWLRFVTGINSVKNYDSQLGLGVGFSVHAFKIGDFFLSYGINFYIINEYMAFGLGQAFAALAFRL